MPTVFIQPPLFRSSWKSQSPTTITHYPPALLRAAPSHYTVFMNIHIIETEYALIRALIDARNSCNITQKELAAATGIAQSDISKIENGLGNPTIRLLQRLANGLNMNLKVEFVPKKRIAMH